LVFYIERPSYIDVLRVLNGSRDIPAALGDGLEDC
jgi:plasmid stabilization system protein ParE